MQVFLLIGILTVLFVSIGSYVFYSFILKNTGNLAALYEDQKYEAIIKQAEKILEKQENNIEAHYYLGMAYFEMQDHRMALSHLRKLNKVPVIPSNLSEVLLRERLAHLFLVLEPAQYDEAIAEFMLLKKIDPRNAQYMYQLGNAFEKQGKNKHAVTYYKETIKLDPRHEMARFSLSIILINNKYFKEAEKILLGIKAINPDNYDIYFYLGRIKKEQKNISEAINYFNLGQKSPNFKRKSIIEKGTCLLQEQEFQRAIIEFERVIKLIHEPNSNEMLYTRYFLAMAYENLRDIEKALSEWEIIFNVNKKFKDVAQKLEEYKDLRGNDDIKDYITAGNDEFQAICSEIVTQFDLEVESVSQDNSDFCEIIAIDQGSSKWRNTKKRPRLFRFFRLSNPIDEVYIRQILDKLKEVSGMKAIIVTSQDFTAQAINYSENRPIDLINRDNLQQLLTKKD